MRTASAVNSLKRNKIEQAREELQEGMHLITKRQKPIKLTDKSEHGWATVNEYLDDELASDEEDARKIRKAEKSAKIKVQEKDKKRANQRKSVFDSKNRPRPSLSNQQFSANLASRIPSTFLSQPQNSTKALRHLFQMRWFWTLVQILSWQTKLILISVLLFWILTLKILPTIISDLPPSHLIQTKLLFEEESLKNTRFLEK